MLSDGQMIVEPIEGREIIILYTDKAALTARKIDKGDVRRKNPPKAHFSQEI